MGGTLLVVFMSVGAFALMVLGYVTGYVDGLNKKEDEIEKVIDSRGDRKHKRIDFDLRGRG